MARDRAAQTRRQFVQGSLALAGFGLLAGCGGVSVPAQLPPKIPRVGYLGSTTAAAEIEALRDGLHELGHVEGRSLVIEERWAESNEQLPALAAELVGLPVDLIVTGGTPATQAVMGATRTIPIVFLNSGDPVQAGLVASLARPGGNVTGLSSQQAQTGGKRLQLLREMVPGVSRVMFLTAESGQATGSLREAQLAAQALGVQLFSATVGSAEELPSAFEMAVLNQAEALLLTGTPLLIAERGRIVEFATAARLPLIAQDRAVVADGGLGAYGPSSFAQRRRAATYVDKILKGARPADLPVEQPTEFEFVINLKTAQALGLTIPPSVLQQATEVIQ